MSIIRKLTVGAALAAIGAVAFRKNDDAAAKAKPDGAATAKTASAKPAKPRKTRAHAKKRKAPRATKKST